MKYISTVVFIALLGWTWCLAMTARPISLEQHIKVENGIESDVRKYIQRHYPSVTDVSCQQLYTEDVLAGSEMIAHFRCQAVSNQDSESASEQTFEGFLRIYSNDGFATWGESGGEIIGKEITFINGFKIGPETGDGPASPSGSGSEGQSQ